MAILVLGDSHLAHFASYPWMLARHCTVRAQNGAAATDLLDQLGDLDPTSFDLVAVSVGTNDCGVKPSTLSVFLECLRTIVERSAPTPVLMVNNPGAAHRAEGVDHELLRRYAVEAGALVQSYGGSVLEVADVMAPMGQRAWTVDGVHVNKWGYLLLLPALRRAVRCGRRKR